LIKQLKKEIDNKFGKKITYAKDCDKLSKLISDVTKRNISSTTLRRFYGLMSSKTQPSQYTLDTLSFFIGYANFEEFQFEKSSNQNIKKGVFWNSIKLNAKNITQYTLTNASNNSLIDLSKAINRKQIDKELSNFIKSDKTLTALIAPSGFGKTIALSKWIMQLNSKDDIVLFAHASIIFNLFDLRSEQISNIGLNLLHPTSTINYLRENLKEVKGRFVIVIDAIDELFYQPSKLKHFYSQLIELSRIEGIQNWLKIIFSIRENTFEKYLNKEISIETLSNYYELPRYYTALSNSNVPIFSDYEVAQVLGDNFKNSSFDNLPIHVKELLRIPINLELFSETLQDNEINTKLTSVKLYQKIFEKQLFNTSFSEEKQDIVWKIIDFINVDLKDHSINKNDLKDVFQIHLKTEGNYYNAYNELIQKGIISEENNPNQYGFTTIKIRFKHLSFFYYLAALKHIDTNKGLDYNLFEQFSKSDFNDDYKINVLTWLYKIAYNDENFEALRDFWGLNNQITTSTLLRNTIGICFRYRNSITDKLGIHYAKNKVAHKNLFERFVDINNLTISYEYQIQQYLLNKDTQESKIFAYSLLYYSSFLKMNKQECISRNSILENLAIDNTITAYPVSRKLAYSILHLSFIENKALNISLDELLIKANKAYQNDKFQYKEQYLFDVTISFSLLLVRRYQLLYDYIQRITEKGKSKKRLNSYQHYIKNYHQSILEVFRDFADFKINGTINKDSIKKCEAFLEKYIDVKDSFQYVIPLCLFLIEYYKKDDIKSEQYFNKALSISQSVNYKFFEALILQKSKKQEDISKAKSLIVKSGFQHQLF
jgi:hypothetical protein